VTLRPHNDPDYRAAKAWIKAHPDTPCWECGQPVGRNGTPDHNPPISAHTHQRGTHCCQLRPHCRKCSDRQGAGITNTRLIPVTNWFG
jgi:hypothetical protein